MLWLTLVLTAQVAQPDVMGPYAVGSQTGVQIASGGEMIRSDLYWPTNNPGTSPIVIAGHGFARNSGVFAAWGAHLASHGIVVVAPNFPGGLAPDHVRNGGIMRDLLAWARTGPRPISARVDPTKGAYLGHSAGGLASFLAAAQDPSITALVGLDPVDANSLGVNAAPMIQAPTLVLAADPNNCNSNASANTLYGALDASVTRASWRLHVVGATHCDAEDPSNRLCTRICGGEDPARRTLFRRYATAHLLAAFGCGAQSYLPGGALLMMDVGAMTVDQLDTKGAPFACGMPTPDAGAVRDTEPRDLGAPDTSAPDLGAPDGGIVPADAAPAPDAAPADAGDAALPDVSQPGDSDASSTLPDAASAPDSGAGSNPIATPGSSCRCTTGGRAGLDLQVAVGLGLLVGIGARRRSRRSHVAA